KRECRYEYRYDQRGDVSEEIAYNRRGAAVWTFQFTGRNVGHYKDGRGFPAPRAGSGAAYVEFVWSPEGFEQETWYLDPFGKRRPAKNGVTGIRRQPERRGFARPPGRV